MGIKLFDQARHDHERRSYLLTFPRDLDPERVEAWLRSISGTLRPRGFALLGAPSLVFEVYATPNGITHVLRVPWQHADYIVSQLRTLVVGVRVAPHPKREHVEWTSAVEVGLTNTSRTLRIDNQVDQSHSLLASLQALSGTESILMQWVVSPAIPTHPPLHNEAPTHEFNLKVIVKGNIASKDEVDERRKKLEEPNMLGVLRVAATADTRARADHLIYRIRASLASSRGPSTRFVKRLAHPKVIHERITLGRSPMVAPIQISLSELAALIAWPLGDPHVVGISPALSRHLPPSPNIPASGRVIGIANMPGAERDIALSYASATRHMHVLGRTGTGKSTLLANMMAQDIEADNGVVLIEAKGDLFESVVDRIPARRMRDVIIIDVNDSNHPVGFNIFDQGNSRTAIDELCSLVAQIYKDVSSSLYAPQVLYHMMHALAEIPGSTFIDLPSLMTPQSSEEALWRDDLVRQLKDSEIKLFMQRFLNMTRLEQDRMTGPVYNRTWQFTARPEIRHILGQRKSSFKMDDVIKENKIVLVNLNGIRVGQQTASLTGTLLVNSVWQSVRTVKSPNPNFLYLDEFQDFTNLPVDLESMLAKARSSGLGAVLAHQNLSQLPTDLRSAIMTNTASKVVFRVSADDARLMAKEMGTTVEDSDLSSLPEHEAIAMIGTDAGSASPVSVATKPLTPSRHSEATVRLFSRQTYGRALDEVKREVNSRQEVKGKSQRKRPRISGEGWGES